MKDTADEINVARSNQEAEGVYGGSLTGAPTRCLHASVTNGLLARPNGPQAAAPTVWPETNHAWSNAGSQTTDKN